MKTRHSHVHTIHDRLRTVALISFSLLKVWCLYKSGAYSRAALETSRGIYRELSQVHTRYAQFKLYKKYTSNCYMNPVSRAYIKTLELTRRSMSYIVIWF